MPRLKGQLQEKQELHAKEAFTVKLCPTCNIAWDEPVKPWESHFKYKDFPKIGIEQQKICPECENKTN